MTRRGLLRQVLAMSVVVAAMAAVFSAPSTAARDSAPFRPRGGACKDSAAARWEISRHDGLEALQEKRYADAERLLKQAVGEAEQLGPDRSELAEALDGLGLFYMVRDRDADADPLLARALQIEEKASGPESVAVAESLEHLALVRVALEQYDSAETLARRALAIREKQNGPDDSENAECLNILSGALFLKGERDQAEPFWARSLAIQEKTQGPDSVDVARTLQNKGVFLLGQALSAQMKAFSQRMNGLVDEKRQDPKDENEAAERDKAQAASAGLDHSGDVFYRQAEELFERVLAIREKVQGVDHTAYRETLDYLVHSLQMRGDHARARPWMERSLEVREKALGPDHPEVAFALVLLADESMEQGEYRQAEPLLRRALAIQKKVPGAAGDEARETEEHYESLLQKAIRSAAVMDDPARRPTEADRKYLKSMEIGLVSPNVMALFNQTSLLIIDQRFDDAGLAHIRGLVNLETLEIHGRFTDSGLVHLETLADLKELTIEDQSLGRPSVERLSDPGITGAGLAHLEKLSHLKALTVYGPSAIDDAGLAHLAALGALEHLILIGTQVHGPGLGHLRRLSRLQELNLASTLLDDAGLAEVPPLGALQTLDLAHTKVSDAGLVHLRKLTGLRTLNLVGTRVTDAGIEELKRALPELKASRKEEPLPSRCRVLDQLEAPR